MQVPLVGESKVKRGNRFFRNLLSLVEFKDVKKIEQAKKALKRNLSKANDQLESIKKRATPKTISINVTSIIGAQITKIGMKRVLHQKSKN